MSINSGDMSINSGEREDKNYGQSQPGNREVEILNSLDETEIGPSDNDSEFQEILGHFEPVFSQVTSGSKWLKRLTGLLSGVDKLGYSYHKSLTKIVELERLKVRNLNKDDQQKVKKDKMGGNWKAQLKLYDILDRIAFANLDFSSSVKVDIVGELEEAIKDNQMRIKTVYKDVETFLKILNASFLKTKKLKHKCSAAIKTRNQILQRDDTLKEDRKNKMSIFSKISVVVHNSPTSAESKVKSLKLQYEEAIQHANALKETWETKKLPEILMMLEKIEKDRVQKMKENGLRVVNALKSLASSIQESAQAYESIVSEIDVDRDISDFVHEIQKDFGPSHFPEKLQDEIINWDVSEKEGELSTSKSLKELLFEQKAIHPNLKIPHILVQIVSEIRRMDGFRREGIFRISAHVDDIKRAKQQIREGKDVEFNDPFCAADVLKRFIRELPDSLFEGYYLACVQLAKSEAGLSDYRTFWESMKLPSEHRALLEWLFDLILEVSELPYSSTSKMCLRNYAIVFAPNLLRPDSEDDSDWMLHLQNAPYEVSFIYNLLQALSKSEEPLSTTDDLEEDSKVNSEVIFKSRNRAVAESDQKTSLMGHRRLSSNLLSSGQEDSFHLPSDDSDKE